MNKIYKLSMVWLLLTLWVASFVGCKDTLLEAPKRGQIELSKSEVIVGTLGGKEEIEVRAIGTDWRVRPLPETETWIKVQTNGSTVTLVVEPSELSEERSVELVFVAPEAKLHRTLIVRQHGVNASLTLDDNKVVFDRKGGSVVIPIKVNGTNWTVNQPVVASWLEVEPDPATKTLKLRAQPVSKDGEGSGNTRSTMLILSYGTNHHILDVRQNGWQYFILPLLDLNATPEEILAHAKKEELTIDEEYEKYWTDFYPDATKKYVMAFRTTALEGALIAYYYSSSYDLDRILIRANKGKAFDEDNLKEWLKNNGFRFAYSDSEPNRNKGERHYYYASTEETTTTLSINNSKEYYERNPDADYKAAVIELSQSSNEATLNKNGIGWVNLPTRNNLWISDPRYKAEHVIEFEKARGMVFAPNDEETVLNDIPEYSNIKYKTMAFLPENTSLVDKGQLRKVVYQFNIPGWMDPNDSSRPMEFNSNEPLLAGSIARRFDLYSGVGFLVSYNPVNGMSYLKTYFLNNAKAVGYKLAKTVGELGWFYFVNKETKMVMIVQGLGGGAVISYGRDEQLFKNLLVDLENLKK